MASRMAVGAERRKRIGLVDTYQGKDETPIDQSLQKWDEQINPSLIPRQRMLVDGDIWEQSWEGNWFPIQNLPRELEQTQDDWPPFIAPFRDDHEQISNMYQDEWPPINDPSPYENDGFGSSWGPWNSGFSREDAQVGVNRLKEDQDKGDETSAEIPAMERRDELENKTEVGSRISNLVGEIIACTTQPLNVILDLMILHLHGIKFISGLPYLLFNILPEPGSTPRLDTSRDSDSSQSYIEQSLVQPSQQVAAFDAREPGSLGRTTSPETTRFSSLWYPLTSPTLYDVNINLEQNVSRGIPSQSDKSKDGKADDGSQKMRREGKVSKRSRLTPGKYGYCRPDPRGRFVTDSGMINKFISKPSNPYTLQQASSRNLAQFSAAPGTYIYD